MGLFDRLFGKKKTISDIANKVEPNRTKYGHVTTEKVDVSLKNYDNLCKQFIAFDVETTGLSCTNDVIIEVGAVKFFGGNAVQSYNSLINEGKPVPDSAYQINHISTKMLVKHGRSPGLVYRELTGFFGDAMCGNTFICAHNASFDFSFLEKALERFGYNGNIRYVDTLALSRKMIKGLPNYKQETVAKYFNLRCREAHRATSDAETCGEILVNLLALKKEDVEKERIREEKCIPTDEEKEVFAIIATAMKNNGSNIQNLRSYRNSSNYVLLLDVYNVIRFKLSKKKSFVVIPKVYAKGLPKTEECTVTEGTENVRLLFDDPFELVEYGQLFSRIYADIKESQGTFMNLYEAQYLAQATLTGFTDFELDRYLEGAKKRRIMNAELQEQAHQKEIELSKLKQAKKEEKEKFQQENEKKKQAKTALKKEQQELIKKMLEESMAFSKEDIAKIAKLSAENGKRAVIQLDDEYHIIKIYESVSEASSSIGIAPKTIRDVANGKYKHGGGFCWKYADESLDILNQ